MARLHGPFLGAPLVLGYFEGQQELVSRGLLSTFAIVGGCEA